MEFFFLANIALQHDSCFPKQRRKSGRKKLFLFQQFIYTTLIGRTYLIVRYMQPFGFQISDCAFYTMLICRTFSFRVCSQWDYVLKIFKTC